MHAKLYPLGATSVKNYVEISSSSATRTQVSYDVYAESTHNVAYDICVHAHADRIYSELKSGRIQPRPNYTY